MRWKTCSNQLLPQQEDYCSFCTLTNLGHLRAGLFAFQMSASRSILGPLARTLVAPRLQTRSLATSPHVSYGFQDPQIPGWTSAHGSEQISHQHPTTLANGLVPIVIEQTGRGERSYDIYSRSALHILHIHYPTQKSLKANIPGC